MYGELIQVCMFLRANFTATRVGLVEKVPLQLFGDKGEGSDCSIRSPIPSDLVKRDRFAVPVTTGSDNPKRNRGSGASNPTRGLG